MSETERLVVTPISRQTCKKMVRRPEAFLNTYLVTLSAEDTGIDSDIPFFVRWVGMDYTWQAQMIVLGPTGKYGTAIVNETFYNHVCKLVKTQLGIDVVTGIKKEEDYDEAAHERITDMFPGLQP